ncbi:MAG: hypothetical protein V1797_03520 [Pseudomonadota bacterium]
MTVLFTLGLAAIPAPRPAGLPAPWAVQNKPVERRMLPDCMARAVSASPLAEAMW